MSAERAGNAETWLDWMREEISLGEDGFQYGNGEYAAPDMKAFLEQVAERDALLGEAEDEIESLIGCLDRSLIVATGQPGNARALLAKIHAPRKGAGS